jgi:hypothetical protein
VEEPSEEQENSPIFFQVVVPEEVQPVLETTVESRKKRKQKIRTDEQSSTACNCRYISNFTIPASLSDYVSVVETTLYQIVAQIICTGFNYRIESMPVTSQALYGIWVSVK